MGSLDGPARLPRPLSYPMRQEGEPCCWCPLMPERGEEGADTDAALTAFPRIMVDEAKGLQVLTVDRHQVVEGQVAQCWP